MNSFAVFIPQAHEQDDCWRGPYSARQAGKFISYAFVGSPDLQALSQSLKSHMVFFAVHCGSHFVFVDRQSMRSFKCAYGHHRRVIKHFYHLEPGKEYTNGFERFVKLAARSPTNEPLTIGDKSRAHAVFLSLRFDIDQLMNAVDEHQYPVDDCAFIFDGMSKTESNDISALTDRVRADGHGLNQDFFNIVDDMSVSRFVCMTTGQVFKCSHNFRYQVICSLRANPACFKELQQVAEQCKGKIYNIDMKDRKEVKAINFLSADECDEHGKYYAMDGTELREGDVVNIDIVCDMGAVGVCDSTLCGQYGPASRHIKFRVHFDADGRFWLREALPNGLHGRYLVAAVHNSKYGVTDSEQAILTDEQWPGEESRIVFRRHNLFKHVMIMEMASNKASVATVDWIKCAYGAVWFTSCQWFLVFQFMPSQQPRAS
ncbi:hypothetical protein GQ42DRAFT_162478 [Ramicandelaber brevisporus]|nr:hypothetical protein GQ42DRAFT_163448 [Ramicandelaber brevisporus]KAI8870751.1 hypothetical protein GQ42DRAFT_162478 [Ramicandelaber brevisporus]